MWFGFLCFLPLVPLFLFQPSVHSGQVANGPGYRMALNLAWFVCNVFCVPIVCNVFQRLRMKLGFWTPRMFAGTH